MSSPARDPTERLRQRMSVTFEANQPADNEVIVRMARVRARRRLARNRRRMSRRPALLGALTTLLIGGSALAWAFQTGHLQYVPEPQQEAPLASPAVSTSLTHQKPKALPTPVEESTEEVPPSTTLPRELLDDLTPSSPKSGSPRSAPSHKTEMVPQDELAPPKTPEEIQASWERVASEMREGNSERAQAEIAPLSQSDDPETRDSAQLLLLRIQLGSKKAGPLTASPEQVSQLKRLSSSGASSSIRSSARRLLRRVSTAGN